MPFYRLSVNEIRDYCKQAIESLEYWLRRLIDEALQDSYGVNYLDATDEAGNNIINKTIRERIKKKVRQGTRPIFKINRCRFIWRLY